MALTYTSARPLRVDRYATYRSSGETFGCDSIAAVANQSRVVPSGATVMMSAMPPGSKRAAKMRPSFVIEDGDNAETDDTRVGGPLASDGIRYRFGELPRIHAK